MEPADTSRVLLEDLSAQVLATDPSVTQHVEQLRAGIEQALAVCQGDSAVLPVLQLAAAALKSAAEGHAIDKATLLGHLAGGLAMASAQCSQQAEQDLASLDQVCRSLRSLIPGAEAGPITPAKPTAAPAWGADADLMREFAVESCERLAGAEAALLALESDPANAENVNTVLRSFHTIKGAAGFLGLEAIQRLAHLAENLLIRARDGQLRLAGVHADLALKSCDLLRTMVQNPAAAAPAAMDAILSRLAEFDGKAEPQTNPANAPAPVPAPAPAAAVEPQPATANVASVGASEGSVRIGTRRMDELINLVGELVIAHSIVASESATSSNANLLRHVGQAQKIIRELQDLTMGLRMVPLRATFQKMSRLVHDLSRKSGKPVQLVIQGQDTEIDRNMVEVLADPLVHMIRNAVDHGLEDVEQRRQQGKSEAGTLTLSASHCEGNVLIELSDDGRGLDRARILEKAVERGLVGAQQTLAEPQIDALIFHPGLSTAQTVTDVSGRGVGMDVVRRNVEQLRGRIEVRSTPGQGTRFSLRLPLTMAIVDAMALRVGTEQYLLPTISIQRSYRPAKDSVRSILGQGELAVLGDQMLPVIRLHKMFGVEGAVQEPAEALLVVVEADGRRCALMVDQLLGQQQVVVKALGATFANTRGVCGGAILGNGKVGLILDAAGLLRMAQEMPAT